MRKLPRPTQDAGAVYTRCIGRVRNRLLRTRLTSVTANVTAAAADYSAHATATTLQLFPRSANVGVVTKDEMIAVYSGRMVPKTQPGRSIYDALISVAPHGKCPLCGIGQVGTLDHHLPKSEYPVLTVVPVNLVPSCSWCQTAKKEAYPTTAEQQTIHPYFDDFENERWLAASVVQSTPAAFLFSVVPPAGYTLQTAARLRRHMSVFSLDKLFASNAAEELVNIRFSLQRLFNTGGAVAVRAHLSEEADSREAAFKNSWQTAMYRAAERDNWFCNGGFALA